MFSIKAIKKSEESCSTIETGCCSTQPKGKIECPSCQEEAKGVLNKTLESLLNDETKKRYSCLDGFHYCKTSSCEVVYFRDKEILKQENLNVIVGLKDGATPATMCYCFEWSREKMRADIEESGETNALEDIKTKMKNPGCSCEVLNPSGGCCLADVTKAIKEIKNSL